MERMKVLSVFIEHAKSSLNRPFSYLCHDEENVAPGFRVKVRFGHQNLIGYVDKVEHTDLSQEEISSLNGFHVDFIQSVYDQEPLMNAELLSLAEEVASYYMAPKIAVLQAMLPPSLKPASSAMRAPKIAYDQYVRAIDGDENGLTPKQIEMLRLIENNGDVLKKEAGSPAILKRLIEARKVEIFRKERNRFQIKEYEKEQPHDLTFAQSKAMEEILSSKQEVVLLQGVTGSGKTEVYLHLSEKVLAEGKNILMLVPEISLTPIMVEYFSRRFKNSVAILHSELTPAEKYDEYRRIASGKARVVVGARSAVFAPLDNIGLIILDEEHVESYKQDNPPYYHAREVAIMRAKHFGAKVVLGSATPSLETKARAMRGVYGYAELKARINEKALPQTHIVDLTKRQGMMPNDRVFSKAFIQAIETRLQRKEQVMVLLNRRGYASYVTCSYCGYIFSCPECGGNLTYHKHDNMMKCHHCGYVAPYPEVCPKCGRGAIMRVGFGTERIVKVLQEYFPDAKIDRLDGDIGKIRSNIPKTLQRFRDGEFDILVGTQIIAKGHDFANVTLVGVALADMGLSLPSYRASERTFQLIAQAVGRSGRGDKLGEAIIQTYNPTHYAITLGAKQDYEAFFVKEMQMRKISHYPPYANLILVTFSSKNEDRANLAAHQFRDALLSKEMEGVSCVGPLSPYFSFVGGFFKKQVLIKYGKNDELKPYLEKLMVMLSGKGGVDFSYEVDPLDY